jgi:hypothetical protein
VRLLAVIPFGCAVNPITGTNWEGTGVAPDLKTADTLRLDDGLDMFRLRIEKDASGKVTGLTELYDDGSSEKVPRTGG